MHGYSPKNSVQLDSTENSVRFDPNFIPSQDFDFCTNQKLDISGKKSVSNEKSLDQNEVSHLTSRSKHLFETDTQKTNMKKVLILITKMLLNISRVNRGNVNSPNSLKKV